MVIDIKTADDYDWDNIDRCEVYFMALNVHKYIHEMWHMTQLLLIAIYHIIWKQIKPMMLYIVTAILLHNVLLQIKWFITQIR